MKSEKEIEWILKRIDFENRIDLEKMENDLKFVCQFCGAGYISLRGVYRHINENHFNKKKGGDVN